MAFPTFETVKLRLRDWKAGDRNPFVAMNRDPEVMRYFLAPLTAGETDAMLERNQINFRERGFGFWAAAIKESDEFIGFIGLGVPSFQTHFTPCIEIGWRLASRFWNQGLATEGAMRILQHAFEELAIPELVSFTSVINEPSRRVMEKIGMQRNPADDFDNPRIPEGHLLRPHVLYRARREAYLATTT